MVLTQTCPFTRWNGSELPNATVISLFRHITSSTSVSLPYKILKVCKIHGYNDIRKVPHFRFVFHHHHLFLLLLQTVYLKIDKRAHLYFSIKRFLSLRCMILGQQNRRRIPLAGERQGFTSTSVQSDAISSLIAYLWCNHSCAIRRSRLHQQYMRSHLL